MSINIETITLDIGTNGIGSHQWKTIDKVCDIIRNEGEWIELTTTPINLIVRFQAPEETKNKVYDILNIRW